MLRQNPNKKKVVLGVTGSFGSGKTTVAKMFRSFGAQVLDADTLAHRCISPETLPYKRIIKAFGKDILRKDGTIERKKLASIVFNNKNLLLKLNKLIHPEVIRIIKHKIKASHAKIVVLDAPLLIESGLSRIVDKLIVVRINRARQIKRTRNRTALSRKGILKRIEFQIPLRAKARFADFVIDNNGSITETKKQVKNIWKELKEVA